MKDGKEGDYVMKNKKYLKHLLTALTIILGINIWVGTKGGIGAKAASLT